MIKTNSILSGPVGASAVLAVVPPLQLILAPAPLDYSQLLLTCRPVPLPQSARHLNVVADQGVRVRVPGQLVLLHVVVLGDAPGEGGADADGAVDVDGVEVDGVWEGPAGVEVFVGELEGQL